MIEDELLEDDAPEEIIPATVENISIDKVPVTTLMTIGGDEPPRMAGHHTTESTVSVYSASDANRQVEDPNGVDVHVVYPAAFKGQRHFANDKIYSVSRETAKIITQKGIGKIVK